MSGASPKGVDYALGSKCTLNGRFTVSAARLNPAKGIEKIKTEEGHKPWSQSPIVTYRNNAQGLALLAFELALGTGLRASDLTRMEWQDIEDGGIWVTQGKTNSKP
ncbi:tyrosine-type recombinase/integrase [Pseudophaeobacter sp.]|uniref:tyrosine-type recombinase/integrase n=1 Tax=Pseudophaeobacter sp. TaxID=1971739 RepID=UPI003297180C